MNPLVAPEAFARETRTALSVNVNKIALLRNSRHLGVPSVVALSRIALEAGAQGITVHPRPDQRHVRTHDVHELSALLRQWPHAEYNIEGNPSHNLMQFVRELKPHQCTLVPDSEGQFTSDHGYDLPADSAALQPLVEELRSLGVRVSLFMDPLPEAMRHAAELGVDRVELYTEPYAKAQGTVQQTAQLERYAAAARAAQAAGLGVNAGHDLNLQNLTGFLRAVPGVLEVSIGHALIADALELGLAAAVRAYQRCIDQAQAVPAQ
jgi:pyridoxine 5-phosphate synthase